VNQGRRIVPTIIFPDGSILVEPSNAELAEKLGLATRAERTHYDVIIVSGGSAGLTAALYTAREGLYTLDGSCYARHQPPRRYRPPPGACLQPAMCGPAPLHAQVKPIR
jgi:hypothetical protein